MATTINLDTTKLQRLKVFNYSPPGWGAVGVNGPVIFLAKGTNFHPRLRGNNSVTKYGLPEGSCVIPNKAAYMDDETWAKVVKVVAPGIRKMAVSNVAFFCSILYSTYLTLHLCSSKFSADDP